MINYKLTVKELTVQVHHVLRDLYPDTALDPSAISGFITEDDNRLIFEAGKVALRFGLDKTETVKKIYRELGVEFEKNLHDKYYFKMTAEDDNLIFEMLENN